MDELPIDQEPAAFPEIVRTKTFSLPPMTLEEALVQVCGLLQRPHLEGLLCDSDAVSEVALGQLSTHSA